jgi:hypothetical protein
LELVFPQGARARAKRRVQIYVPDEIAEALSSLAPAAVFYESDVSGAASGAASEAASAAGSRHGVAANVHFVYGDPHDPACTWMYTPDRPAVWRHVTADDLVRGALYRVVLGVGSDTNALRVCALAACAHGDAMVASLRAIARSVACAPAPFSFAPLAPLAAPLAPPLSPSSSRARLLATAPPRRAAAEAAAEEAAKTNTNTHTLSVFPEEHPTLRIGTWHESARASVERLVQYVRAHENPWAVSVLCADGTDVAFLVSGDELHVAVQGPCSSRGSAPPRREYVGEWEPARAKLLAFYAR